MTRGIRLAVFALLLGSALDVTAKPPASTPATPPAAAPAPAPAPAKPAARPSPTATELARLIVPKEMWNQGMEQLAVGVKARMQMHPGKQLEYPKDFPAKVRAEVEAALPYEELVAMHARRLTATYSEPELGELLAFHRSAAGKKWLQQQPANYEAVGAESEARVQQAMPEITKKLTTLAKGYGKEPGAAQGTKPKAK